MSRRLAVAFAAFVLLLGQVASLAHLTAVRHVTCAEHGELVEIASDPPSEARPVQHGPQVQVAEVAHGHDHCTLAALRRERSEPAPAHAFTTRMLGSPTPFPLGSRTPLVQIIALLHVAPKNSPPA